MDSNLYGCRVLVFGGEGFIGRHVVSQILSRGGTVLSFDVTMRTGKDTIEHPGLTRIIGSISDEELVGKVAQGCDGVVFLASTSLPGSGPARISGEIAGHVLLSIRAAEVCRDVGVRTFVFASSGGTVYGAQSREPVREDAPTVPKNAYGVSKLTIEHYLRLLAEQSEMKALSLRITNPYGPGQVATRGQGFVAAAMNSAHTGEPLHIWGDGSTVRDYIYVGDLAEAIARAVAYGGDRRVLNVGTGLGHSLLDIARGVEAATGRPLNLTFDPGRSIDVDYNVLDIGAARRELDWVPRTDIAAGLRLTSAWWDRRE